MSVRVPDTSEWELKVLEGRVPIWPIFPLFICAKRSWSTFFTPFIVKSIQKAKLTLKGVLGGSTSAVLLIRTYTRAQPHAQFVYLPPCCNPLLRLLLWTLWVLIQLPALCYLASHSLPLLCSLADVLRYWFEVHWFLMQAKVAYILGKLTTPSPPSSKKGSLYREDDENRALLFLVRQWFSFC